MENKEIELFEDKVLETTKSLIDFKINLETNGRKEDNYNHLGTLDINGKVLKKHL